MSAGRVAQIPKCAECDVVWRPDDPERWRAYLTERRAGRSRLLLPQLRRARVSLVSRGANAEDEIHREVSNRARRRILPEGSQVEQPRAL